MSDPSVPTEPQTEPAKASRLPRSIDWLSILLVLGFVGCLALTPFHRYLAFGLPAHILMEHIPVVLIPLASLAALFIVWRLEWRHRYLAAVTVGTLLVAAATVLTTGAGDALREHLFGGGAGRRALRPPAELALINQHAEAGERARNIILVLALVLVALTVFDRLRRRRETATVSKAGLVVPAIVVSIVAVLATVADVNAGHLGSKASWKDRVESRPNAGPIPPGLRGRDYGPGDPYGENLQRPRRPFNGTTSTTKQPA